MAGNIINMSTDKARILSTQPGTSLFWRGDNTWSAILANTLTVNGLFVKGTGTIEFENSGSQGDSNATFPNNRGSIYWSGTSDWCRIFCTETASDNFQLIFDFGDDTSPSMILRDRGTDKITLTPSSSTISATTFSGALSGNATTATTATNANYLISNTRMDYGWNGINYFNLSAARSATVKNNQTPYASATWTHILRFNHGNNAGYYTDLAIPFNGNSVWYRRIANGTLQNASYDSNTGWVELLDAINYTSYTVTKTGSGASGSWGISVTGSSGSCTGNAATATKATQDGSGNTITSTYLKLSGGTMTGALYNNSTVYAHGFWANRTDGEKQIGVDNATAGNLYLWSNGTNKGLYSSSGYSTGGVIVINSGGRVFYGNRFEAPSGNTYLGHSNNSGWVLTQDICSHSGAGDTYWSARVDGTGHFKSVYGAVWNDYAEMRNVPEAQLNINRICDEKGEVERDYPCAGRCVSEIGNGEMKLTNKRLQKGCKIISDTFGFCIGETETCKTPIAVTGRVLAYPYENIDEFKNHIGDCVCSGPNGTVSIMNKFECLYYPECIVGIISEIPTYDIWHCGNKLTKPIDVNGRIWIYVK